MISFFTTVKEFSGLIEVIQGNALRSWRTLRPDCEVILLGDDAGAASIARELDLIHVPDVARNEYGSALVSDLFAKAHAHASNDLLCYVNADIILTADLIRAARQMRALDTPFLLCGRRWNLDVTEPLTFDAEWEEGLRRAVKERGRLDTPKCVDYFLFTRELFGDIPPFAIGRRRWDRWLQARARSGSGLYVDATEVVLAVHQRHDYGRVGFLGHKQGPETQRNVELAGEYYCDLRAARYKLTKRGLSRAFDAVRLRAAIQKRASSLAARLGRLDRAVRAGGSRFIPKRLLRASKSIRRFLRTGSLTKRRKIAVIGLGKIGLPLAVGLVDRGFVVTGVDADAGKLTAIRAGYSPLYEEGLDHLLSRVGRRLTVHADTEKAASWARVTILVVPTKGSDEFGFTPDHLVTTCEAVGRALGLATGYHLVVVVSTVMPGWMDGVIRETLERHSAKTVGVDFGLCYWPAFVALGKVVTGFQTPEFVLIGGSDPLAGRSLEKILGPLWKGTPRIVHTNLVNAELAKLALNAFVATKISFANVVAQMCESLPGANVDVVTSVLQRDRRIGCGVLTGGTSYGGPCLPGDMPAFAKVAADLGASDDLVRAVDQVNRDMMARLVAVVTRVTPRTGVVGICGVPFKPGTGALDGSPGLELARRLRVAGYDVVFYDPLLSGRRREVAGFELTTSLEDCVRRVVTVVLTTPCKEFRGLTPDVLSVDGIRRSVVDCWRLLDAGRISQVADYHAVGLGGDGPRGRPAANRPAETQSSGM
jgi:UDPglucose 6-dehydrogenase